MVHGLYSGPQAVLLRGHHSGFLGNRKGRCANVVLLGGTVLYQGGSEGHKGAQYFNFLQQSYVVV